jgi:hypothetical protein
VCAWTLVSTLVNIPVGGVVLTKITLDTTVALLRLGEAVGWKSVSFVTGVDDAEL